jgi:hypothetical protein
VIHESLTNFLYQNIIEQIDLDFGFHRGIRKIQNLVTFDTVVNGSVIRPMIQELDERQEKRLRSSWI